MSLPTGYTVLEVRGTGILVGIAGNLWGKDAEETLEYQGVIYTDNLLDTTPDKFDNGKFCCCRLYQSSEEDLMSPAERECFNSTFERPRNYFLLPGQEQWEIDKALGILDYSGARMNKDDETRFEHHYTPKCTNKQGHCLGVNLVGTQFIYEADKCTTEEFKTIVQYNYCPDCGQPLK